MQNKNMLAILRVAIMIATSFNIAIKEIVKADEETSRQGVPDNWDGSWVPIGITEFGSGDVSESKAILYYKQGNKANEEPDKYRVRWRFGNGESIGRDIYEWMLFTQVYYIPPGGEGKEDGEVVAKYDSDKQGRVAQEGDLEITAEEDSQSYVIQNILSNVNAGNSEIGTNGMSYIETNYPGIESNAESDGKIIWEINVQAVNIKLEKEGLELQSMANDYYLAGSGSAAIAIFAGICARFQVPGAFVISLIFSVAALGLTILSDYYDNEGDKLLSTAVTGLLSAEIKLTYTPNIITNMDGKYYGWDTLDIADEEPPHDYPNENDYYGRYRNEINAMRFISVYVETKIPNTDELISNNLQMEATINGELSTDIHPPIPLPLPIAPRDPTEMADEMQSYIMLNYLYNIDMINIPEEWYNEYDYITMDEHNIVVDIDRETIDRESLYNFDMRYLTQQSDVSSEDEGIPTWQFIINPLVNYEMPDDVKNTIDSMIEENLSAIVENSSSMSPKIDVYISNETNSGGSWFCIREPALLEDTDKITIENPNSDNIDKIALKEPNLDDGDKIYAIYIEEPNLNDLNSIISIEERETDEFNTTFAITIKDPTDEIKYNISVNIQNFESDFTIDVVEPNIENPYYIVVVHPDIPDFNFQDSLNNLAISIEYLDTIPDLDKAIISIKKPNVEVAIQKPTMEEPKWEIAIKQPSLNQEVALAIDIPENEKITFVIDPNPEEREVTFVIKPNDLDKMFILKVEPDTTPFDDVALRFSPEELINQEITIAIAGHTIKSEQLAPRLKQWFTIDGEVHGVLDTSKKHYFQKEVIIYYESPGNENDGPFPKTRKFFIENIRVEIKEMER